MPTSQIVIPNTWGYVRHRFKLAGRGSLVTSAHGFNNTGLATRTATDMADVFWGLLSGGAGGFASAGNIYVGYSYEGCEVVYTRGAVEEVGSKLESINGTKPFPGGGSDGVVEALTWLLSLSTGIRGRQHRGRMYLPMLGQSQSDVSATGFISSPILVAFRNIFQTYMSACDTAGLPMGVLHTSVNAAATPVPDLVTSVTLRGTVGIQRRRLR